MSLKTKPKIVFIVPDGVGIKNYLYSKVISHLKEKAEVAIWSTLPEEAFEEVTKLHKTDISYFNLTLHPEGIVTRLLREATTNARLRRNAKQLNNKTILSNWRRPKNNKKLLLLYRVAEVIGNWASKKHNRILKLEHTSKTYWSKQIIADYRRELEEIQPTHLFITHQRVASLMPICMAAKALGIEVSTAIFSWDNLPKARLSVAADNYLVWSDHMKEEMQQFYPEITAKLIKNVGTPQFEFYKESERIISREAFAKMYGLDASKRWVCYSGDDVLTSPNDQLYLNDVAKAIVQAQDMQLIFRRSPADYSDRYDTAIETYKNFLIKIDPIWCAKSESWTHFYPKLEDIDLQVNLAYHCDAVVNIGSTMAHDFATYKKPCLYINYDYKNGVNWSVEEIYQFQHFRSMQGLNAVVWINNSDDIIDVLQRIKENIVLAEDKETWFAKIVKQPYEENSKLIAKSLL